jgi:hypothetical protein
VFLLLCPLLGWRHLEVTAKRGYYLGMKDTQGGKQQIG